jgi:acyl-CoA synthetase (NDP forming)
MSGYLNELDANKLLSGYKIPMAKSLLCKDEEDAVKAAIELGYPVVMKILSSDILHKTDAGCVFVGVKNGRELRAAFQTILANAKAYKADADIDGILLQEMAEKGLEMIVGMKLDPQFGPVIMAGNGGIYVEVYKDVTLRLLPIGRQDAEKMLKETKIHKIIGGMRGTVYDEEAVIDVLLKVSKLVMENPDIEEIDINPLFIYEKGLGAKGVDALIKKKGKK